MKKKPSLFSSFPRSSLAFHQACQVLVGGVNSPVRAFKSVGGDPIFFEKGKGPHLFDLDGNCFIDYVGAWGPAILGHAHPEVTAKVGKQIKKGFGFGSPHLLETKLAHLIRKAFPVMEKIRLVNSGTEATLSAIRLARGYTGRDKILKFAGCYHGHGDSFLIQAGSGLMTLGLPDSPGVTPASAADTLTAQYNDIASVEMIFHQQENNLAAVIIEPVAGNMGLIPGEKKFLHQLRKLCKAHGTLLIFDEVMSGFRLAWGGAQELYGITPDLVCLGKIVGGGFPVAAYGGGEKIMKHLAPQGSVYQAGTLSGHPVGMTAGIAVLENLYKNRNRVYPGLEKRGKALQNVVMETVKKNNYPVVMNRLGSMFTLFFSPNPVENYSEAKQSNVHLYADFFHALLRKRIYFPPSQFESGFISYAHDRESINKTTVVIKESLQEVFNGIK